MKLCGNKNQTADANVPLSGMVEPNLMGVTLRTRSYLQMKANTSRSSTLQKKNENKLWCIANTPWHGLSKLLFSTKPVLCSCFGLHLLNVLLDELPGK